MATIPYIGPIRPVPTACSIKTHVCQVCFATDRRTDGQMDMARSTAPVMVIKNIYFEMSLRCVAPGHN